LIGLAGGLPPIFGQSEKKDLVLSRHPETPGESALGYHELHPFGIAAVETSQVFAELLEVFALADICTGPVKL
jgi:hypothetical protein